MIDSLLVELEKRIFLGTNVIEQIEDKAKNLVSSHPDDLDDTLVVCCICRPTHSETGGGERIGRVYHVQAFVIVESF